MASPQTIEAAFHLAIGSRGTAADLADSLRERDRTTAEELDLLAESFDRIAELVKQQHLESWDRSEVLGLDVDAWCGEHHCDDSEPVDSTWLTTIGGVEETPLIFCFSGILLLSCDCGQWVAYLRGSVYHHKLVEVMSQREVRLLLQALKLNP